VLCESARVNDVIVAYSRASARVASGNMILNDGRPRPAEELPIAVLLAPDFPICSGVEMAKAVGRVA